MIAGVTVSKVRVTVTIDRHLLQAAEDAVKRKRVASVSAYVNAALAKHVEEARRLAGMEAAIKAYEEEHGVFTDKELLSQRRKDLAAARQVRRRTLARARKSSVA